MDTKVADALIGALIDGRYRVRGRVARGGMATVYTATDERLERVVALKIIHPTQANDPRFLDRFTDEAKTIARLTHPNVVAVYDQGVHEGLPYLVMEFVRGHTLREVLTDRRRLPAAEALAILEQVLAAVAAAHRAGLVHRDIKPENVLVAEAPGGADLVDAVVKVADFGLARAVEASADSGGHLLATVAYVAPELVTEGRADPRTDVYSAGIVLFEMLTGRVPYDGAAPVEVAWQHVDQDVPPPSKYVAGLPPALDDLVSRATRRDPGGRPTDAGALLAEVQAAREDIGLASSGARAVAEPTMTVPVAPGESATQVMHLPPDRPAWARLPENAPPRPTPPRPPETRQPPAPSQPYRSRAARPSGLRGHYAKLVSTSTGRRSVVAGLVVIGLVIAIAGWWFGAGRYTHAPVLVGLAQSQAASTAKGQGLSITVGPGKYQEKIAKGTVIGQQPAANERILKGGRITLSLSLGPQRINVPDESGKAYAEASADLTKHELVANRVNAYDDSMPVGNVLSTDPAPGTVLPPGAQVTVKVSKGKAPITVPNLIGSDGTVAQQRLQQLGLVVAFTQQESPKPANQVIAQSVPDGSGAQTGDTIILTISSGPPMVAVPNVTNQGLSYDQANAILQQAGLVGQQVFAFPGGQVRQQNPGPGTQVAKGSTVQLWVYP